MSYNGSGTFVVNTAGQPVVTGTIISSTAFNALTADLATGLSTAVTKDGQTTPTANLPMGGFKLTGLGNGTAATDSAAFGQVLASSYTTTATAAGTTVLSATSNQSQYFTGATTQTITLPDVTTLPALGFQFRIVNLSSGSLTVNSSGGNLVATVTANQQITLTCILLTGTTAASWDVKFSGATAITGTGSAVRSASPTFTGTITAAALTASGLITASAGLAFANETMLTYDEGTFTTGVSFGGGTTGITYGGNGQQGRYTKSGKIVAVWGYFELSAKGSSTGSLKITGLPFTTDTANNHAAGLAIAQWGNITLTATYAAIMAGSDSAATTASVIASNNSAGNLNVTDAMCTNTSFLGYGGTYLASTS